MDAMTNDFGEVLLWSFWFFIWIAAIMVWFRCLFDMFGDHTLSGWAKAGWVVLLIFLPWIGVFIYLIVRGRSMTDRQLAAVPQQQAAQEQYIQQVAATPRRRPTRSPGPRRCSTPARSTRPSSTASRPRPSPRRRQEPSARPVPPAVPAGLQA